MSIQTNPAAQAVLAELNEETELNLAPIMNLFVILIPFLLLSASFIKYSVYETPAPTAGATSKKKAPTITLIVSKQSMLLEVQSPRGRKTKHPVARTDFARLMMVLEKVKKKYPDHQTLMIRSSRGVSYGDIISLVDLVRGEPSQDLGLEKKPLFQDVIFGDV